MSPDIDVHVQAKQIAERGNTAAKLNSNRIFIDALLSAWGAHWQAVKIYEFAYSFTKLAV